MKPRHIRRGGAYLRVCDPSWLEPADTSYSKRRGGRWNPPGRFGVLYLNASIAAAAANARASLRRTFGGAVTFFDLLPEQRPYLSTFHITRHGFVDAVTAGGIASLALPPTYPGNCPHQRCRAIGLKLYQAHEAGVAARSAAAPSEEELALFDTHLELGRQAGRLPFGSWYPGLAPRS